MDIAALSTQLKQTQLGDAVGLRVLSMAKEQTEVQSQQLLQLMQQSVQPHLGGSLDLKI